MKAKKMTAYLTVLSAYDFHSLILASISLLLIIDPISRAAENQNRKEHNDDESINSSLPRFRFPR